MNERRVVLIGIGSAVLLTGAVSAATGTPALLGLTTAGAAIYLLVGVAGPQLVLGRRDDDAVRTGLGVLAAVAGVAVFLAGRVSGTPPTLSGLNFVDVLAVLVAGVLLGSAAREFRRGYSDAHSGRT